jgi:hypothetical protein
MTPDDDTPDDALTRDYRRTSTTEAGRPAAATRAAILAEARSLAQHRARRDPRVPWAIAASVSVIGIAVLLWRQVGLQTPPSPVAYPATQIANESGGKLERTGEPDAPRAAPPALPASPPSAPSLAKAQSERTRDAAADVAMPARLESAARAAALEAPAPAAGIVASALSTVPRFTNAEAPASVLRKRFPEEYASPSPPHTLWLLRDVRGEVLRTGRLNDSASLTAVLAEVQRDYPARRLSPWVITPLTNERNLPVDLAIATLSD